MTPNASRGAHAVAQRPEGGASGDPEARGGMWQVRGTDGSIATGWYLLPLRLFLGVTFVFAGFQKLSNPDVLP